MKKVLCILLALAMVILSACNSNIKNNNDPVNNDKDIPIDNHLEVEEMTKVEYGLIEASYPAWNSAQSLVEDKDADFVIIGRVTDISFQVTDKKTALPPEKQLEEYYDEYGEIPKPWYVFDLITLYDVDVITTYKGKEADFTQIRLKGGLKDIYVDEQLVEIKKYGLEFIPIMAEEVELKIGETYLFVLGKIENLPLTPMNLDQCIYNLNNPFNKALPNGHSNITAKDIISVFGDDKWDTFWSEWQRDNPDWEERLSKAENKTVEAELVEVGEIAVDEVEYEGIHAE